MNFRLSQLILGLSAVITAFFLFVMEYKRGGDRFPHDQNQTTVGPEVDSTFDDQGEETVVADSEDQTDQTVESSTLTSKIVHVKSGDTLYGFLGRHIQDKDTVRAIVRLLRKKKLFTMLKAGFEFTVESLKTTPDAAPQFQRLIFYKGQRKFVLMKTEAGTIRLTISNLPSRKKYVAGTIQQSLYMDAKKEGAPLTTTNKFVRLISHNIDFQRSIQAGDRFELFMNLFYDAENDRNIDGDILYGALHLKSGTHDIYRYAMKSGDVHYYNRQGKGTAKALLKTPVPGARISGVFGMRKRHPVLGYSKMHRGVDFAAPRGTPILCAGDGVVERASRYGSYGNYIRVRHNKEYATAYAHLHKYGKGVRRGQRVKQGQVIGYVGTTGRSTGPHLHYEVLRYGKQINPQKLKLPSQKVLTGKELAAFRKQKRGIDAAMHQFRQDKKAD